MTSPSNMRRDSQVRTYKRANSVVFLMTNEEFGGLSNMAGGFPLEVNGLRIFSSEALYQACRFPHRPEIQRLIIEQASAMTAKMRSKLYRRDSRPDWDQVRVKIMRWCLRVKLAQNWNKFSELLLSTADRPIVEESRREDFWGAKPVDEQTLVGMNVLGRLLMELREEVRSGNRAALLRVEPLALPNFLLDGRPIQPVVADGARESAAAGRTPERVTLPAETGAGAAQAPLFREPSPTGRAMPHGSEDRDRHELVYGLKPYPAYKDSGVPWLGDVPEHWEVKRTRNVVEMCFSNIDKHTREGELPVRLCNYIDVYKNSRITDRLSFMRATAMAEEIERFRLEPGDVLITKDSESWNDIGVPALVEYTAADLICGYHLALLRPRKGLLDGGYLLRALQSPVLAYQFYVRANGVTRYGLSHDAIKSVLLPLPPGPEQAAIVRFLDHVDRRIQHHIRAKQKLIKLLEEHKQAIIHRAVIRGIDPNVRLKSSGVEWLGDVPEHWAVQRVKNQFRLRTEKSGERHGLELLSVYTHIGVRPRKDLEQRGNKASSTDDYWIVETGDIIANKLLAWMGAIAVSHYRGVTSPAYDILKPVRCLDPDYFHHLFRTKLFLQQFKVRSRGIMDMRLRLYFDQFGQILMPVPPVEEQAAIVAFISDSTFDLVRAVETTLREIALLREYRARLIADAVIGKLDVRAAAARLPDEPEEPEAVEEAEALPYGIEEAEAGDIEAAAEEAEA